LNISEGGVEIRIEDTGIGIPQADAPHRFERFHRGGMQQAIPAVGWGWQLPERLLTIIAALSMLWISKGARSFL
jgi:signal transduction histidine kinase